MKKDVQTAIIGMTILLFIHVGAVSLTSWLLNVIVHTGKLSTDIMIIACSIIIGTLIVINIVSSIACKGYKQDAERYKKERDQLKTVIEQQGETHTA